ncbi:hypothetical protein GSI_15089 [Ganoderma sinense ZZ0214-1]|uniref:Rad4-domain-containing protein n=1 Tax=Ganoderma sinense ZZ0214-1 TaxID=1077348 RepID=A0A2G8RLK3_9APHY|nr:hypothetical protein GSI_15089 [Ganoderma sinense ZZ0214-1]
MNTKNISLLGEESEDDFDWEEVQVAQASALEDIQPSSSTPPTPSVHDYYGDLQDQQEVLSERPHLEITIKTLGKRKDPKKNERAVQLAAERAVRLDCHKIHTVALLMNAKVRNQWINDPLLHARLMSLTPLAHQNAFAMIHKSRVPEAAKRGRLFESAITRLADWWASSFKVVPSGHLRSRTFHDVQRSLPKPKPTPPPDPKGKGKGRAVEASDEEEDDEERYGVEGERIRSAKSLMKHALMWRGSRDTSAQLFTALCRALGIPARLVVSLQSVPWQASVGKPKPSAKKTKKKAVGSETDAKGKGRAKPGASNGQDEDEDDDMEAVDIPDSPAGGGSRGRSPNRANGPPAEGTNDAPIGKGKGKQKATPVIRLRKSKQNWGAPAEPARPRRERTPDPTTTAPVFWTEVFSRADARWIPVDPVRVIINKRKAFDPTPNPGATTKPDRRRPVRVENRMVYVLAFEEDGFARDVTPRYAREFGAKVAKVQQGGKGRREWWERICRMVTRPYRLQRDDLEDEELQANQMTEAMPTTMVGFKDHPLYVLERHLKRDEVVDPLVELGKFRGEPVYPRGNVLQLKTAENWMRQGRTVISGAQPLKWVKQRAVTVNKKRAIEMALADQRDRASTSKSASSAKGLDETGVLAVDVDSGNVENGEGFAAEEGIMQGLYAEHQTELYKPPPVVDGKVPKNDFGNLDLYVPSMLPAGAAHVPFKGTAKIARQLGFDFAEAVTGFEFKKRRAFPVVTGIVIAAENESVLLEAYWEAEQDAETKRQAKRQEQVLKRWTKLVQGLRIRQRLIEQYADRNVPTAGASSSTSGTAKADGHARDSGAVDNQPADEAQGSQELIAGGFLVGVDDVVQPYALPRNLHEIIEHASTGHTALGELQTTNPGILTAPVADAAEEQDADDVDVSEQGREPLSLLDVDDKLEVEGSGSEDDDDAMEEVVVDAPPLARTPKTMQELAEEAARRNGDANHRADDEEELVIAAPPLATGEKAAANGRKTSASRSRTKSGTSTPRPNTRGKSKASAASTSKAAPRRTRKRTRSQVEHSDSDREEEGGGEANPPGSTVKKPRTRAAPPPAEPSTRVLRTRKPKDADKVREEKEMEAAYRRAIAD